MIFLFFCKFERKVYEMLQLKLIRKIYSLEWESSKEDLVGIFKEFKQLKKKYGDKYLTLEVANELKITLEKDGLIRFHDALQKYPELYEAYGDWLPTQFLMDYIHIKIGD